MSIQIFTEQFVKITDQTVTNSTLTQDEALQFYVSPLQSYKVEIFVPFEVSGLLPAYKWSVYSPSNPAPTKIILSSQLMVNGVTTLATSTYTSYPTVTTATLTGTSAILKIDAVVQNSDDSGTFVFNFACANGTSVTNLAGAYIRYVYGVEV